MDPKASYASVTNDWRKKAYAVGWSDRELDQLGTLLYSRHHTTRIEEITTWVIHLRSDCPLAIEGVDRNGVMVIHTVPFVHRWTWRRFPSAGTTLSRDVPQVNWCPVHGAQCAKNVRGCAPPGAPLLVDMEFSSINIQPKFRKGSTPPPPVFSPVPLPSEPPRPAFLAPSPKPSTAPKRKKGTPLPGQMMLGLPAPKSSD